MLINIPVSPYARPEMFEPDVLVEDNKWYPLVKGGAAKILDRVMPELQGSLDIRAG